MCHHSNRINIQGGSSAVGEVVHVSFVLFWRHVEGSACQSLGEGLGIKVLLRKSEITQLCSHIPYGNSAPVRILASCRQQNVLRLQVTESK